MVVEVAVGSLVMDVQHAGNGLHLGEFALLEVTHSTQAARLDAKSNVLRCHWVLCTIAQQRSKEAWSWKSYVQD